MRGGGHGQEWDKNVRDGAGAGIVGMVCGVHWWYRCCVSIVKWVGVECSDQGSSTSFYVSRAMGDFDLWPYAHMTGSGEKGKYKK